MFIEAINRDTIQLYCPHFTFDNQYAKMDKCGVEAVGRRWTAWTVGQRWTAWVLDSMLEKVWTAWMLFAVGS